ncbi:hypothetical protein [Sorangium sp. So ce1024]|uniref:hypothetical protein n=1 Tax=unclassified Sorangium TaxID=2621164 RepID=UPI003F0412C1
MQEAQSNGAAVNGRGPENDESGPQQESPKGRAFLANLVRELFQTERSARTHSLVEAQRLGDVPPAHALRAVSAHAEAVLEELPALMSERELPVSAGGSAVGAAFSALRDHIADHLLSAEKSYRGTLLGMRHGVDLVELIQYVAAAEGDTFLAAWCARWLAARRPLVEAVAGELAWFAARPARATRAAKDSVVAHLLQGLVYRFESAAQQLRRLTALTG